MTPKQIVERIIMDAADNAQSLNFEEIVKRERSQTAHCPECSAFFVKTTNNPDEVCFLCLGKEET